MLLQRIITAFILAPLALFFIFKAPVIYFICFILLINFIGVFEFVGLLKTKYKLLFTCILQAPIFFIFFNYSSQYNQYLIFFIFIFWFVNLFLINSYPKLKIFNSYTSFINIFLLFTLFIVCFNILKIDFEKELLLLLLIIWGADIFAYFGGKLFGKKRLAPKVSSGKTIEGFFSGVIAAIIITLMFLYVNNYPLNSYFKYMFIAFITVIFSVVGDLYESVYKREAGVKDSGKILPGHGGLLDRIDSLIAATPIFTALLL